LEECQEKNARLEKDIEKLSEDYLKLKALSDQFNKYVVSNEDESGNKDEPST